MRFFDFLVFWDFQDEISHTYVVFTHNLNGAIEIELSMKKDMKRTGVKVGRMDINLFRVFFFQIIII